MSAAPMEAKKRERAIDLFKGLLVIGMVYCHTLQFFSDQLVYPDGQRIIDIINLITFSGFVFSFGYVSQLAYYSKPFRKAAPRMVLTALKTILAFYVSGAAFRIFIDGRELDWETIRPILLIRDMPGWSEFLISFTYLMIIGLVLFVPLRWLAARKALGFAVAGMLLIFTFIPYGSVHLTQLGPLIGTREFASFPVLQYLPYYIAGVLFAKHRITWDWRVLIAAAAASGSFVWRWVSSENQVLPERFPPSVWWIIGSALILYGYYLLSRLMDRIPVSLTPLEAMGRNVLWFLVMSNMLIFALKSKQPNLMLGEAECLWLAGVLLAITGFGVWIVTKPPRNNGQVFQSHKIMTLILNKEEQESDKPTTPA
ncbi:acyltransferase [Paenibacillus sp. KQZ6P-2]|uniref:Acyltransferase n=1 Tax=Paenibacillus mangrovi TaxID=2931978 RepID=A0A9X2B413_9BACL|nr:acyltransferase [Paenibacillus mangrovi]MCJ8014159.1 acyltransferase [Paenibacillus mangrovi]